MAQSGLRNLECAILVCVIGWTHANRFVWFQAVWFHIVRSRRMDHRQAAPRSRDNPGSLLVVRLRVEHRLAGLARPSRESEGDRFFASIYVGISSARASCGRSVRRGRASRTRIASYSRRNRDPIYPDVPSPSLHLLCPLGSSALRHSSGHLAGRKFAALRPLLLCAVAGLPTAAERTLDRDDSRDRISRLLS